MIRLKISFINTVYLLQFILASRLNEDSDKVSLSEEFGTSKCSNETDQMGKSIDQAAPD